MENSVSTFFKKNCFYFKKNTAKIDVIEFTYIQISVTHTATFLHDCELYYG